MNYEDLFGFSNPEEDQTVPIPAAPGLLGNTPGLGILDRLKSIFMPSQAQAAEPQGGGMDIGALLPGMILTQLGQQMQLPRNQRNPAAIPQVIMGVIKAQQGSQEEKQKLAMQKLLFLNELQKGKTPTSFDAAILAADAAGDKEKVERLKELKRQSQEKPEKPVSERFIEYYDANGNPQKGLLNPDTMTVTKIGGPKKEKEPAEKTPQWFTNPDDPTKGIWVVPGQTPPPGFVPRPQATIITKETEGEKNRGVLAQMLVDYEATPKDLSRRGDYNTILADAKKIDPTYSPSQANLKMYGAQRWLASLSSPQQARLETAGVRVIDTIEEMKRLTDAMKLSGFTPLNYAEIESKRNLASNTPEGQLAIQYLTAANDLKEIMATAANGGYAPTESVWKFVTKQINENYGIKGMHSSLDELQKLMKINVGAGQRMRQQAGIWTGNQPGGGTSAIQPSDYSVAGKTPDGKTVYQDAKGNKFVQQ